MMQRLTIPIPGKLKQYVKHIWVMDGNDTEQSPISLPFFADGYPGIFFHQSDETLLLNQSRSLSTIFLYGQTVKPVTLHTTGFTKMIVFNFYPHALKSLFQFNAGEVTDTCLDLELLPAMPGIQLVEQLWNTEPVEKQIGIIFRYLQHLIDKNRATMDNGLAFATAQIMALKGAVSLKQMQAILHMTERTFERRFEEHIGISPKLFSKIAQFQGALQQLSGKKFFRLSDIAYENGYADQSHFIRSFKRFTGQSPLAFQKQRANWLGNAVPDLVIE